ncbi:hypothetical protein NP233_g12156 [Leucocoprinus birnbaumii]|uniref:Uncharacterized protein n=1 Tax=Leucocoprinus birnbaumii TaxID=56174 RepID=A0AAD5VF38_9AGAR|nr:hypothetical protein NP233_g12156 [Leucocoprinus birnbaumii]
MVDVPGYSTVEEGLSDPLGGIFDIRRSTGAKHDCKPVGWGTYHHLRPRYFRATDTSSRQAESSNRRDNDKEKEADLDLLEPMLSLAKQHPYYIHKRLRVSCIDDLLCLQDDSSALTIHHSPSSIICLNAHLKYAKYSSTTSLVTYPFISRLPSPAPLSYKPFSDTNHTPRQQSFLTDFSSTLSERTWIGMGLDQLFDTPCSSIPFHTHRVELPDTGVFITIICIPVDYVDLRIYAIQIDLLNWDDAAKSLENKEEREMKLRSVLAEYCVIFERLESKNIERGWEFMRRVTGRLDRDPGIGKSPSQYDAARAKREVEDRRVKWLQREIDELYEELDKTPDGRQLRRRLRRTLED